MGQPQPGSRLRGERGVALFVALMATMLLAALGVAIVLTTSTEVLIVGNYRNAQEGLYAADAALERTLQDLLKVPDWNVILAGPLTSSFIDGASSGLRVLSDGTRLDLTQATNRVNCGKATTCSAADLDAVTEERPWGANNPRRKLYAHAPVVDLLPIGTITSPLYVIVWAGDDPSENDDDPAKDGSTQSNPGTGVVALKAVAYGPAGTRKVIEATVARTEPAALERGYVAQRGLDERNRHGRRAAVQIPGKSLTESRMILDSGGLARR